MTLPPVNPTSSMQNAWVQDWLAIYFDQHPSANAPKDLNAFDRIIECIQEGYSYAEHERERSQPQRRELGRDREDLRKLEQDH